MEGGGGGGGGMFVVQQTAGTVLCCLCGVSMAPNPANMCVACLRSQVDITEGLQKRVTILYCPECRRYLHPPRSWVKAEQESRELLTFCIKRLKNLNKVRLVDAAFVWTEPHSKRLKVRLKIQKEVMQGAILEQSYVVEYVVEDHMCDACTRASANPEQWVAVVQVRQKVDHKRTFFFLEQLILKHSAASSAINIKQLHDGLDFFFASRSHALKFVDFLGSVVPVRSRHDKQLVSHDSKNNSYNYKFTFSVEICPICKDDLVCLPQKVSATLGGIGPLVLCARVSNSLLLLDPITLRSTFVDAAQYWRAAYRRLLSSKQLVEYVVLDVEPHNRIVAAAEGSSKYVLAQAQVARTSDFGKNDTIFSVTTHLGHLLRPGDNALGYDLYGANTNDAEVERYGGRLALPEVVLVRKSYEEKRRRTRGKARPWALKSLGMEVDEKQQQQHRQQQQQLESIRAQEMEKFLEEVEEDPELRSRIKLYKNPNFNPAAGGGAAAEEDDDPAPSVPLEELLGELTLDEDDEEEDDEEDEEDDDQMQM